MRRKTGPDACGFQKLLGRLQKSGCAQISAVGCGVCDWRGGVDKDDGKARSAKGRRRRQASYATARNEDVCCDMVHAPDIGCPPVLGKPEAADCHG